VLLAGCSSKPVVVVYSPHGADVLRDYETLFEQAHPEVDVQWLDMGSEDVYAKVRAERGRPAGDVWWGGPATLFRQAASEGLLEAYRPSWADAEKPAYRDAGDRWYATHLSPLAIMFNNRRYRKEDMPQTWDALLDPKWKGKITLRKPAPSGAMRTFLGAMIVRAGSEDAGFAWLKQLHAATDFVGTFLRRGRG
jgi:iron(III) transport system substrate-binding protein